MAGYTRVDTINNIADGNVINAADLDGEFDGVQAAFNSSTGHNHDGTAGEGAPILALGPSQDVTISASILGVKTTNTVDLGTNSLKFKDFYLAGAASIGGALTYGGVTLNNAVTGTGNMVLSASPTLTGTITAAAANFSGAVALNGNTTLGDTDADTITQGASYVTATQLKSAKTATNTLNLAAYDVDGAAYTNLITLTAANAPTLTLTSTGAGTINNMSIGATTPLAGTFTTLSSTGNTTIGDAEADTITVNGQFVTGTQLKSAQTATNTLSLAAYDTDGAAYTNLITLTASTTPTLALTSIGVGTINNMSIGATTTSTGAFTTLSASGATTLSGNTTIGDAVADTITVNGQFVTGTVLRSAQADTNTLALAAYDVDGAAYTNLITLTASNTPTLALTSTGVGTINNMSIGATTASTGAFTTLSATGNTTIGDADTDTITQAASYVTDTVLRSAKLATNTLALAAYDVDGAAYTNLVTLTAANAPTLALTSTGVGTINNMSIGATTASTGAFTTLSATDAVTFNTVANAQSYTTTGAGTITISSGTTGTINNMSVGATTRSTGAFTTLASNGATTFTAGTASTTTGTGTLVITGGLGVSGRINAANFDGIVGANTAAAGAFTTLSATGVTTVQAGTAALPAITTTGDTNTGIYFPAADTIAFTEGGVESMRIDSDGIVQVEKTFRSVSTTITGTAGGTITPTSATTNQYTITALGAAATIAIPSGTPIDGQKLTIRIKDNGTARALTWTTSAGGYRIIGTTLPATTVISKTAYIGCVYNSADSFWDVVAVAQQA